MSNQQRPFSWFRLAPFGRQLQPAPAPAPPPTPRPTAFRAPAPQPFRPPAPQPRPTIRPPAPAITSPPPTAPTLALFPGVTTTATTTTAAQPAPRSPTPSTAPGSPAKSIPASPIIKLAPSSSPTSPTLLPITSSSFTLRSPETKTPDPYSSSLTTNSQFPKSAASPPKTAPPPATTTTVTAPTAATTALSSRISKPSNESPPKYPQAKPLFRPPAQARATPEEEKKLVLGQDPAKMNEKSAMDNKKVAKFEKLPRRLVTLIGQNKGAIMVLNPNSTKKSYTNVFGGKSQTVGNKEEGEMGSKKKKEDQNDMNTTEMEESTLIINSNVQGVNNSILDDSSLTHHDPGFHIFFSMD